MVDKVYCIIINKFRLISYSDNGNAYKTEKLRSDISVIMICIPNCASECWHDEANIILF
jgi:hypothetical protein